MKHVEVAAGIIFCGDEILCMKRPLGNHDYTSLKFEFPGGKIENGESKEEALKRELIEEMDLKVEVERLFMVVDHTYPDFKLTMHSFICKVDSKDFVMKEHIDFKWLKVKELNTLEWIEADKYIVDKLMGVTN